MIDKILELLKYVLLSVIQGVGEVLPISSSAHLVLFENILGIGDKGVGVELVLHLASLLALFICYKKTIYRLFKGGFNYVVKGDKNNLKEYKFIKGMIISLIPTCIVGYFFNDYLDSFFKYPFFIGIFLVFNSMNLYLIRNKNGTKRVEELSNFSFLKIGFGQSLGLVPGFSRSGSALSMCYREKMNKEDSQIFTFLMLFPLVVGSIILNIDDFSFLKEKFILMIISFIISFAFTLISLKLLDKIIKNNKLYYFSYYCFIVGVILMFVY